MSQLQNVTIRVVPYDVGVVPAGVNRFAILRFAQPEIADVVLLEELTSHRYLLRDPAEVETYSAAFRRLVSLSADLAASQVMFRAKMAAYKSKIR
jgi:uncharacterized protein DUF5753